MAFLALYHKILSIKFDVSFRFTHVLGDVRESHVTVELLYEKVMTSLLLTCVKTEYLVSDLQARKSPPQVYLLKETQVAKVSL